MTQQEKITAQRILSKLEDTVITTRYNMQTTKGVAYKQAKQDYIDAVKVYDQFYTMYLAQGLFEK